ncbi:hypothetical protein EUTSA_v10017633mg [Eutrema salsugineum]|uniref:At2g29880-like C-terminal domain-containing protein n=1 Tax=Eutrema salsugineum TaxID=72664 RepID=V4NXF3_EUTSA|nr:hypothetical protein EUTSA_v10017633mg [Eutrema salsugineum]
MQNFSDVALVLGDLITKQFTPSDEPYHNYLQNNTFEDYEDLQIIFESVIVRGNTVFGLGEREDVNHMENVCEVNIPTYKTLKEKPHSRKRAKPPGNGDPSESTNHGDYSENVLTEMIEVSTNLINFIQQKEEMYQREVELRETEKKKNNHIRYDAVIKILTLKMNDVFVSMSVEEHLGWILRNT